MLEHPSIRWYSSLSHPLHRVPAWAVKIHPVRTISRKLPLAGSSETARGALQLALLQYADWSRAIEDEDTVRPSWRHEELGRNDLAAYEMNGDAADHRNR